MSYIYNNSEDEIQEGGISYIVIPQMPKLTLIFGPDLTREEIIQFKAEMLEVAKRIKASPIRNFSEALIGDVYVGTSRFFDEEFNFRNALIVQALYKPETKKIYYYTDGGKEPSSVASIIHEFAHKYHDLFLKNGFENEKIIELYNLTKSGYYSFPTRYSAEKQEEFFAVTVTLITLGLVKHNQLALAEKIIEIIEKESI